MEISVKKVHEWQQENKPVYLLDVRRDNEREFANIGGTHIPLDQLGKRFTELDPKQTPLVVYCHHGVRSMHATQFLKMHGFDALSLRGGIEEWSLLIDPSVPRY